MERIKNQTEGSIQLRRLAIGYRNGRGPTKLVARDLNAVIRGGELTCLLGANGIGKSTLLRTLAGFQPKLAGTVSLFGEDLENYSEKKRATLISVVLTERIEVRNLSVRSLVALGRSPYTGFWGRLTPEDKEAVDKALALVKIENLATRMVMTLSDGERQKAMIAKSLAQDTPIILLDEPTAFLDFPSKVEMMQLLHRLSRETAKTIFLSTHDLDLALQVGDKIWLMDSRAQIHVGTPEDLSLNGTLSAFFARKGIFFDRDSGLFRVENDTERQIRLQGEGQAFAMVRKALLRNRIHAHPQAVSDDCITVKDRAFYVSGPHRPEVRCDTIEALLKVMGI